MEISKDIGEEVILRLSEFIALVKKKLEEKRE
jgi:hypothetical protein